MNVAINKVSSIALTIEVDCDIADDVDSCLALVEASAASTEAGDSDGAGPGCITECLRCKESSLKAPLPAIEALVDYSAGKVYCRHHGVWAQGNFTRFTVHKLHNFICDINYKYRKEQSTVMVHIGAD